MHFRLIDVYEAARAEIACGSDAAGKRLSIQNRSLVGSVGRPLGAARRRQMTPSLSPTTILYIIILLIHTSDTFFEQQRRRGALKPTKTAVVLRLDPESLHA